MGVRSKCVRNNMSDTKKNSPAGKKRDKKPRVDKEVYDPEEYVLRKRLPPRSSGNPNDVYVNNKTDFKAQLARCFKRLETQPFVVIHGLGAAAPKAINLALQLQLKSTIPLNIEADTGTIGVIGTFEYFSVRNYVNTQTLYKLLI